VPAPYTQDDARAYVTLAHTEARRGTGAHLLVVDGDAILASCAIAAIDWRDLSADVGYWVAPGSRRRGLGSASVRALSGWAFAELGLERLTLVAAAGNLASQGVARAAGFVREGTMRSAAINGHSGDPADGRTDMLLFGLLPSDLTAPRPPVAPGARRSPG
jgi:RimJ/RimL family protein N-acetyltransferase